MHLLPHYKWLWGCRFEYPYLRIQIARFPQELLISPSNTNENKRWLTHRSADTSGTQRNVLIDSCYRNCLKWAGAARKLELKKKITPLFLFNVLDLDSKRILKLKCWRQKNRHNFFLFFFWSKQSDNTYVLHQRDQNKVREGLWNGSVPLLSSE